MKVAIRFFSGRLHHHHANVGWLDALQLQWQISQYWMLGFMMLCVMLALLEGRSWFSLLSGWCALLPPHSIPSPSRAPPAACPLSASLTRPCPPCRALVPTRSPAHDASRELRARLTSMGFALIFLDLAFTYIKFKLLVAVLSKRQKFREKQRGWAGR